MPKQYLIERISLDPSENSTGSAVRWGAQETTSDLAYAERCVNESSLVTSKDCWAIRTPTQSVRFREIASSDESNVDRLTELQKEIGYLPGSISPVAMLGLMGECGEVAAEINTGFSTFQSNGTVTANSLTIARLKKKFEKVAANLDAVKKHIRNDTISSKCLIAQPVGDGVNLKKEMADMLYYLNALAINVGTSIEELAGMGYDKVMEKRKTMAPEETGN